MRRTCPTCGGSFDAASSDAGGAQAAPMQFCPHDGTALVTPSSRDPLVGRVIGERYRLDARIGRGAMGTVYRALHTRMDKPVAVKLLRAELAGDGDAVARFHREARAVSRLDHENCIRVTDFGQSDDGLLYLVMELLDGASLGQVIAARGPLSTGLAAALGCDVALALQHAHERGVIHRDLKADNVMIARRGGKVHARAVVKVLDFGLAKIAGDTGAGTLTRAGSVFGTPEYMAPEQAEGLALDARTDLYALGVLLYLFVTGTLPFHAPTVIALLGKHMGEAPEPPRARRPGTDLPEAFEALILRCLAKKPEDRPQSADEVVAVLETLADRAQLLALSAEHVAPTPALPEAQTAPEPSQRNAPSPTSIPTATSTPIPIPVPNSTSTPAPTSTPTLVPTSASASASPSPSAPNSTSSRVAASLAPENAAADDTAIEPADPPRRPSRTRFALGITVAALGAIAVGLVATRHPPVPPTVAPPALVDPLVEARHLLENDDVNGADRVLSAERARRDGAPVQLLLGELAQRRGNRLGALAHFHRAVHLAPREAEPHARLAAFLHLLGQPEAACKEARAALAIQPKNAAASAAVVPCQRGAARAP